MYGFEANGNLQFPREQITELQNPVIDKQWMAFNDDGFIGSEQAADSFIIARRDRPWIKKGWSVVFFQRSHMRQRKGHSLLDRKTVCPCSMCPESVLSCSDR